jgi:acetylglutamate kinase
MSLQQHALEKAAVLSQALPWLLEFRDSIVVIKFGGNAMIDEKLLAAFSQDIVFLKLAQIHPIIVHGGGPQITQALDKAGVKSEFLRGLRYTSAEAIPIIKETLIETIQRDLVQKINQIYHCAVGFSGDEDQLLLSTISKQIDGVEIDLGLVGQVKEVNTQIIKEAISGGQVPVISTLGIDHLGRTLNINADDAAAAIASAVGAKKIVILTDVIGLMKNYPDPESLISQIDTANLSKIISTLDEGMRPKMQACLDAVAGGVGRAHVIDGRIAHALLVEVFTDQGAGTMVVKNV